MYLSKFIIRLPPDSFPEDNLRIAPKMLPMIHHIFGSYRNYRNPIVFDIHGEGGGGRGMVTTPQVFPHFHAIFPYFKTP